MPTTSTSNFEPPPPPALWSLQSARFHMMLMLGCVAMILGMIRGSISMAMVCITFVADTFPKITDPDVSEASTLQQLSNNSNSLSKISWSLNQQAFVHAGFYFGSLLVIFPSHQLIKRYRAKRILTCSLLVCGIGSLLTPLAVISHSHWLLAFARAIIGMGNGLIVPCGFAIVAKWFPRNERSDHIGILCSMVFTSIFCQTKFLGGWPVAFELYGFIALGFLAIWELHAAHKPRYSSYVTASELEHIRGNRLKRSAFCNISEQPPLKPLLLSPCVIAMCLCCFTHSFILSGLTAYLPTFNRMALHMNLQQNGISSGVPFLFQAIAELLFHLSLILMQQKGISSTTTIKLFASIATCGAASCFLSTVLLSEDEKTAISLLISLAVGAMSAYKVGFSKCATTIAPQFNQFVLSYLYSYSQLAGTVSPIVIALLVSEGIEKKILISLMVAFMLCNGVTFLIFGHGRRELYVDIYGHTTASAIRRTTGKLHSEEEIIPGHHSAIPYPSAAIRYREEEVNIPLKPTSTSRDLSEEEFTSDD
ncbi:hypothetical protein V3C99_003457, partial [Haemonchus contortus]